MPKSTNNLSNSGSGDLVSGDQLEGGGGKVKRQQMIRDGEEYKSVRKLKSGADSKKGVKGVTVQKVFNQAIDTEVISTFTDRLLLLY